MTLNQERPIMPTKTRITETRPAGPFDQVVTVEGGKGTYRKKPCAGCPWVTENDGTFPAEAFRHSASTAYDMSDRMFGCHESGTEKPATCAGFLLRGADHNLAVRLAFLRGRIDPSHLSDGGRDLHASYASMATANGVDPTDPVLARCR